MESRKRVLAVVGLCGSGKTEAVKFFEEKGYPKVYFGEITFDVLRERGEEFTEDNEKKVREELRSKHGMGVYATLSLPKIKKLLEEKDLVIVESLYSWDEFKIMKDEFGNDFFVLAVYAAPEMRYKRLSQRPERPLPEEAAKNRDYAQIENLAQAGPIAMADFTIINTGTLEELQKNLEQVLSRLS